MSISIERLTEFASLAWGEKWIVPFAETISKQADKPLSPSQVHQWISGARPVPTWVAMCFPELITTRVQKLRSQTVAAHKLGYQITDELFAQVLPPRPKPAPAVVDDGPAPRIG
jgi:hypothetical protein